MKSTGRILQQRIRTERYNKSLYLQRSVFIMIKYIASYHIF